ncbi:MAG: CaiB/BaiF CoA-transferase family protein [Proteobacteria bacterium]|nr:CaiB/BaiF CoA-transferase family protein [Pseudomonadota bacterium]
MSGPLTGLRIIEMVGLGPGPFCAMLLADMGAEVIRIDQKRQAGSGNPFPMLNTRFDVLARGRRSLAADLKNPAGKEMVLRLVEKADALIEGYRPGVMERLGLGPEVCLQRNPRMVFGRMTGWGQHGPLAAAAGHDLNYIALSGALHAIGRPDSPPPPPLNLLGDFGGGGMMLAFGIACALLEARSSGQGQVVDAAMTDGAALLSTMIYGFKAFGSWTNRRGANLLDGGAHFYDSYACADGKFVAIGAIEPQFYALLLKICGITDPSFDAQMDVNLWPELKTKLAAVIATKTRAEWCALMEDTDVCFAPVLDLDEAPEHPHNKARQTFIEIEGVVQPAPAPRFSRTPPQVGSPPAAAGQHTEEILADWGLTTDEIKALRSSGAC